MTTGQPLGVHSLDGGCRRALLEEGEKRWIDNMDTFTERGYNWYDVITTITCKELHSIPDGVPIPANAGPPPQP